MYKNPEEAIRIGNAIITEAKDDVDYKIKAYKLISDAYSSKRDYQKSLELDPGNNNAKEMLEVLRKK